MFNVGRYDPNETKPKPSKAKTSKDSVLNNVTSAAIDGFKHRSKVGLRKKNRTDLQDKERSGDCDWHSSIVSADVSARSRTSNDAAGCDSSSILSFNDSDSSFVGLSSHEGIKTLKVIAPSQPENIAQKRKRTYTALNDEIIDDYDNNFDVVESTNQLKDVNCTNSAAIRAIHLSKLPIAEVASQKHWGLPKFLLDNLKAESYTNFFPIQCMVIPDVIESDRNSHLRGARDICCHAPTGSGKTLAFVLPLLTLLHNPDYSSGGGRGSRRLRALVVLPGRDLAKQVYDVFIRYAKGSDIKIGLAVGGGKRKADLLLERRSLVVQTFNDSCSKIRDDNGSFVQRTAGGLAETAAMRCRYSFDQMSIHAALQAYDGTVQRDNGLQVFPEFGGQSALDILVSTPGRLVDHLDSTPGFTLQHLKFLVIDEADKLINQPYQNWIRRVLEASNSLKKFDTLNDFSSLDAYTMLPLQLAPDGITYIIDPITHRGAGGALPPLQFSEKDESTEEIGITSHTSGHPVYLRKMLFSATLTQDPQKMALLGLKNPKYYDANRLTKVVNMERIENDVNNKGFKTGSYAVPEGLTERFVECTAEQKPLVLLALLLDERIHQPLNFNKKIAVGVNLTIVFTSSVDSTHRLARLLQLLWEAGGFGRSSSIAEFSSAISTKHRAGVLQRCHSFDEKNRVTVLVCSDGMSRGMDLPSVSAVINYDVPAYAKTYIHRCGRTARAGKEGTAISILKRGQMATFRKMRRLINGGSVEAMEIEKDLIKGTISTYKRCLRALKKVIHDEENENLLPSVPLDVSIYL